MHLVLTQPQKQTTKMLFTGDKAPTTFDAHGRNPNYFGAETLEWDGYHKHRPAYPQSLFDLLFAYRDKHASSSSKDDWRLAADFGSGPGTILPDLLRRFARVEGSDLNQRQITLGKEILSKSYDETRLAMHVGAAGQCDWIKDGQADLFTAAEAVQWFDSARWVEEAAKKLKPKGTLSFWYYSPNCTIISHPEASSLCNQLFSILFESVWSHDGFPRAPVEAHALKLRNIRIDGNLFEHEERHYWNLPKDVEGAYGLGENAPSSFELVKDTASNVAGNAKEIIHPSSSDCYLRRGPWTTDDLLEYIKTLGMPMDILTSHKDFHRVLDRIHAIVGGSAGTFYVGWWLALVMATRK